MASEVGFLPCLEKLQPTLKTTDSKILLKEPVPASSDLLTDRGQTLGGKSMENSKSMRATSHHECMENGLTVGWPIRVGLSMCTVHDQWEDRPMGVGLPTCTLKYECVAKPDNVGLPTIVESLKD